MAGDRSGFRDIYPALLEAKENTLFLMLQGSPHRYVEPSIISEILEDRDSAGQPMIFVPDFGRNTALEAMLFPAIANCGNVLIQAGTIREDHVALSNQITEHTIDWGRIFSEFDFERVDNDPIFAQFQIYQIIQQMGELDDPIRTRTQNAETRLHRIRSWKHPFDAIEPTIAELEFPIASSFSAHIYRNLIIGSHWFGVGEWSLAYWRYVNAFTMALATNNITNAEMLARFIIETYIASGALSPAITFLHDLEQSPAIRRVAKGLPKNDIAQTFLDLPPDPWRQMYESISFGFALQGMWIESLRWLARMIEVIDVELHTYPSTYNIVGLLRDYYEYKRDFAFLQNLSEIENQYKHRVIAALQH